MSTSNPWLSPLQRSYNDIKSKLIQSLNERVPEITDMSEGNIFIIILSIFAGIAEVIHYYIDGMAQEAFLPTCRRYSSLCKHAKLVDYHIKSAIPSSVDLTVYMKDGSAFPVSIDVPQNTVFVSSDGKQWVTTRNLSIEKGTYTYKIPVVQKEIVEETELGTYTSHNIVIGLGDLPSGKKYVEGSMVLTIDGEAWRLVDTFAYSSPGDRVYKVELDSSLQPYLVFGDGQFGRKPALGSIIRGQYYLTYGVDGNISENQFDKVPEVMTNVVSDLLLTNTQPATGGSDYEDFDTLKAHIPLSLKTLGVAITKEDYESISRLMDGVDQAYCNYICGKYVEVYITPDGGYDASTELIENVKQRLESSKVLTTRVSVYSTHAAKVFLSADVTGRQSFKSMDIANQVRKALVDSYNYQTSSINKPVRQSDLYALIDNQSMVDYLTITELYLLPYPIAINPNSDNIEEVLSVPALNISFFRMLAFETSLPETDYENCYIKTVIEDGKAFYKIYANRDVFGHAPLLYTGQYGKPLEVSLTKADFQMTINLPVGNANYENGTVYQLTLQPMGSNGQLIDLIPRNYNIPIIESDNIKLTIHEVV